MTEGPFGHHFSLKIACQHGGSGLPSNAWIHRPPNMDPWPTQVDIPNDITICSTTFEGLTIVKVRPHYSVCSDRPHLASVMGPNNRPHLASVMGPENTCMCVCLVDDKRVVGRRLHAVLYMMLTHYQLAEAVRLTELVLRLRDVRRLAAIYSESDSSMTDLLSSYSGV